VNRVQVTEKGGWDTRDGGWDLGQILHMYMFTEVDNPLMSSAKRYSATNRISK
jgi:hypothetical protein